MYMVEVHILSKILVLLGALNWGLVGILNFDLVAALFGRRSPGARIVYALVGLAAIYLLVINRAQHRIAMRERSMAASKEDTPQKDIP